MLRLEILNRFFYFFQMNFTTFFHLTNKEMNKDPLNCLEQVLTKAAGDQNGSDETVNDILHSKLFSTRQDVQKLLDIECEFLIFISYFVVSSPKSTSISQ